MLKFAVRKTSSSIFHDAVARKDIVRLAFLMESNRRQFNVDLLDEDGLTALQRACFTGNLKLVQLLVSYGANLDIQDKEGWSVLHAAAVAGNLSILRYLVAVGADVSVRNDLGELPIDVATDVHCVIVLAEGMKRAGLRKLTDKFFAKRPQLKTLIKDSLIQGLDNVNDLNDSGISLLHEMAGRGDSESVQFLLEHGAEVNRQSLNGSSPLHEAVQSGNIDCTLLLLRSGADLYAETDGGFLPIDIARENTIRDILRRAMSIR
ncbi:predicted protein [Nematostella vectensis]|uniref:Uncharacterized protein n=1 Tax=Nematostella vectensis TaxID=45351 RepID=A7SHV7_NEMVE|nr:predicted protein [Nematostella vectensis]|eukprot:XP_001628783.1 predicted protein [Nematostella vectensis]